MAEITISIPDAMNAYVADRVGSGQYDDASEYFRELVRREQEQQEAEAKLRNRLAQSAASGISELKVPDIMERVESELRAGGKL